MVSTGIVPPAMQEFCDDATPLIKDNCECCFNAEVVGTLFAGAIETEGIEPYLDAAFELGARLVS